MSKSVKKVVLAYSGGLDTSIILKWLQTTYQCEVVTFTADLGQGEELEPARRKAEIYAKGAGVTLATEASAKDIGLPLYPGSRRHKDKDNDSSAGNFGLWGGGSGFKLIVLKMESDDSLEKIADFYKKALAKYGKVLDCSHPAPAAAKSAPDDQLSCADDKPDKGGALFKAGTKQKQHLVAVQPAAHGSLYQLVYLAHWDDAEKK